MSVNYKQNGILVPLATAGGSSFSGDYNDLTNKPTIECSVEDSTLVINLGLLNLNNDEESD